MILLILLKVLNRIYCRDAIVKSYKWDFLTQIACAESNKTGLQVKLEFLTMCLLILRIACNVK